MVSDVHRFYFIAQNVVIEFFLETCKKVKGAILLMNIYTEITFLKLVIQGITRFN